MSWSAKWRSCSSPRRRASMSWSWEIRYSGAPSAPSTVEVVKSTQRSPRGSSMRNSTRNVEISPLADARQPLAHEAAVFGMGQLLERARADELVAREAGDLDERLVDLDHPALVVAAHADERHPDRGVLERAAEAQLRLALPLLRLAPVGDVARRRVDQLVLVVGARGPLDPAMAAVLRQVPVRERRRLLARPQRRGRQRRALAVVGVHELDERARHQLLARPAQRLLPRAIQAHEVAVEARGAQQVARELEVAGGGRGLLGGGPQPLRHLAREPADRDEDDAAHEVGDGAQVLALDRGPDREQRERRHPAEHAREPAELDREHDDRDDVEEREAVGRVRDPRSAGRTRGRSRRAPRAGRGAGVGGGTVLTPRP